MSADTLILQSVGLPGAADARAVSELRSLIHGLNSLEIEFIQMHTSQDPAVVDVNVPGVRNIRQARSALARLLQELLGHGRTAPGPSGTTAIRPPPSWHHSRLRSGPRPCGDLDEFALLLFRNLQLEDALRAAHAGLAEFRRSPLKSRLPAGRGSSGSRTGVSPPPCRPTVELVKMASSYSRRSADPRAHVSREDPPKAVSLGAGNDPSTGKNVFTTHLDISFEETAPTGDNLSSKPYSIRKGYLPASGQRAVRSSPTSDLSISTVPSHQLDSKGSTTPANRSPSPSMGRRLPLLPARSQSRSRTSPAVDPQELAMTLQIKSRGVSASAELRVSSKQKGTLRPSSRPVTMHATVRDETHTHQPPGSRNRNTGGDDDDLWGSTKLVIQARKTGQPAPAKGRPESPLLGFE